MDRFRPTGPVATGGFTLIELLVVFAILATLASLLFPTFLRARQQATRTRCVASLAQIGKGLALYLQDWDGVYPSYRTDARSAANADQTVYWHDHFCQGLDLAPGQICWVDLLRPNVPDPAVFFCPDDGLMDERPVTSYEFKLGLADDVSTSDVAYPSDTAQVWEQWAYHDHRFSEYDARGAMNVLFTDGRTAWKRLALSTSARFGRGPDLHPLVDTRRPRAYQQRDF